MKKKEKVSNGNGEGKINTLPESVLHEILSYLDMKQVVQASVLSTRWRNLWRSVPDLRFDRSLWTQTPRYAKNSKSLKVFQKDKAMDFVEHVLLLRDDTDFRSFHLTGFGSYLDSCRIMTWLIQASKHNVKQLHLEVDSSFRKSHELPLFIFTSHIQVFKLKLRASGFYRSDSSAVRVRVPKSVYVAPHLSVLDLSSTSLPKGDSNGEIVFSSSVLETLVLDGCRISDDVKVVDICGPHLKKLKFVSFWSPACCHEIRIRTPELTSLELFVGNKKCRLENLSSLISCCIGGYEMQILNEISNVATLAIHGSCYQNSPASQDMLRKQLNPFPNLRCLKLLRLASDSCIRAVVNILISSPCIETLVWEAGDQAHYFYPTKERSRDGDWEKELSFQNMFYQLKYIDVRNLGATKNELKFIGFLLENALVLENINIAFANRSSRFKKIPTEEERKGFCNEVHYLPKVSANVSIIFSQGNLNSDQASSLLFPNPALVI